MEFNIRPMLRRPKNYVRILMVGRIIMNHMTLLWKVRPDDVLQKRPVGRRVKDRLLAIDKPAAIQVDRPKDLLSVSLTGRGNQGLLTHACPGLIKRRVLAEAGFILKEQGRAFRLDAPFNPRIGI